MIIHLEYRHYLYIMATNSAFDDGDRIRQKSSDRLSRPFLTKYEFNQIISLRTLHLSKGAIPLVELPPDFQIEANMDLRKIALEELLDNKLPYAVKRKMPNGKIENWRLADLSLIAVRHLLRP